MNDNYMNAIDRSVIRINQIVPEIMDRMLEIYKAYAPEILKTVAKRINENGGRLNAYKSELKKQMDFPIYGQGVQNFLDEIPFTSLVKIVEPTIHKTFLSKIGEISDWCNNECKQHWKTNERVYGSNHADSLQDMVSRAVQDTEGFQRFVDYELTGIFPGRIPSYGVYRNYDHVYGDKIKNPNYESNEKRVVVRLPVIGVYNKFNANLFNKIFTPEARILNNYDSGVNDYIDMSDTNMNHKSLFENYDNYDIQNKERKSNPNVMLLDVDTVFNAIAHYWSKTLIFNLYQIAAIDDITRGKIEKLFHDKSLFPEFTHDSFISTDIALACRTFEFLELNKTTSPEYKEFFREFDLIHSVSIEGWGLFKKQIVASAITTYLANVCSRTQNFANNMLDDVVNKYLSITAQDNSIISDSTEKGWRNISTVRSKAKDFYALFRNFLTTPTMSKRNMLNPDDIAISQWHNSSFHMSVRQFACYILKKIYEHECVTYNTSYNISNTDTNFKFIQTEAMAKKMLIYISAPEAKAVIELHKNNIGAKSLLGHEKSTFDFEANKYHPLAYLARNHRALSSIYKHIFVSFVSYIDAYRLKKNISKDNENAKEIHATIYAARTAFMNSLKYISNFCSGQMTYLNTPFGKCLNHLNLWTVSPIFTIGLFYDGQFNVNYNLLNSKTSILTIPYCGRIIDVLTPKNLRRQSGNIGYGCNRFAEPQIQEDTECCCLTSCCDGGDVTCSHGTIILSDIDDYSTADLKDKLGIQRFNADNENPQNVEISQAPETDFGQFDGELDSGLNSYESLSDKVNLNLTKIPSLKTIEKVALKLNNLKTIKTLDLATVAYAAQLACEKLDFNKLSKEEQLDAKKRLKVIDAKLRETLDGRIYKSTEELNMNSMESIDFVDFID